MVGQCTSDKAAEIFNTTVGRKAAGKVGIRTPLFLCIQVHGMFWKGLSENWGYRVLFAQLFENPGGLAQSLPF